MGKSNSYSFKNLLYFLCFCCLGKGSGSLETPFLVIVPLVGVVGIYRQNIGDVSRNME